MDSTLYREEILSHYQHPHNTGKPHDFTHSCTKDNPLCGDVIDVYLTVRNGLVEDVHFVARGCAISVASASMLSDHIRGWKVEKVKKLNTGTVLEMLKIELTPTRLKCALLPLEAFQKALDI